MQMIKTFLIERRSWIILFLFLQALLLFVAYIDSSLSFMSVLYFVFLSMMIFTLFLIVRYHRETKFYKVLAEWDVDVDRNVEGESPFEKLVEKVLAEQTAWFKQETTTNRLSLEQEKDELLAWIHEVKTPLTTMNLIIDRLDNPLLKSQLTHEWLRIHLLLDTQLHQRRIPFIENDLYIEETDLKPLLFQEMKTLQSWCMQKGIGFEIDLAIPSVLSDPKWLAFIIRQLLSNAVKYSEDSDIVIQSYKQADRTILKIQDSGRGIDRKDLPRIFDKGFTSTTKHDDHAATGMGLYLTIKAAEPLLIHIDVESEPGKGTTVTLVFPGQNDFVHIRGM